MKFPNYFADANSSFNEAEFVIFGVPYDQTYSFRKGAAQAPKEIRKMSWNFETYNLRNGVDLRDIKLYDYGDLDVKNLNPKEMVDKVRTFTSTLLEKHKFPIAIGGEHSITPGIIQAFPRDVAVLSLDAHIDFREQYENEPYNHACVIRRIVDHIDVNNIAVLGIRSAEKEEFEIAKKMRLFSIDAFTIHKKGISDAIKKAEDYLKNKDIYLSIDIDVIDPGYAPGTSTPEPFGLTPFEVLECIEHFSKYLIGFDVVEVCPPYDNGEAALLAAKLTRCLIGNIWKKP